MTPALIISTVSSTLRISVEEMQSKIAIDDGFKMVPSTKWSAARVARGIALHLIKVKCPLAPEYGIGRLLSMDPHKVDGEREEFRERLRRNPEMRKSVRQVEEAFSAGKGKGKVRL